MKHPGWWILAVVAACLAVCFAGIAASGGAMTHYEAWPRGTRTPRLHLTDDALVIQSMQRQGDQLAVTLRARHAGRTEIRAEGESLPFSSVRVGPFGLMVDLESTNFTGCRVVTIAVALMFVAITVILYARLLYRCKHAFYSYRTAFTGGMAVFMSEIALTHVVSAVRYLRDPYGSLLTIWNGFSRAGYQFIVLTAPFLIGSSVFLIASNVSLVRHEGLHPRNLLASITAVALVGGLTAAVLLDRSISRDSLAQTRLHTSLVSLYTSGFVFMEAMLLGTLLCGVVAALGEPPLNRDFIIINGCKVGRDGKPLPLLRGRADRALAFARKQQRATGRSPVLVPSGGQGADEPVSEARAMADYLMSRGVPESDILLEDRSVSTEENMRFSKALIQARQPKARVGFATSGYHVFRTGLLSAEAGLDAEGMGSRTKWYYLPNAFLREYAGLLAAERRPLLRILLALTAFFALLSLTIM